MVLKLNFCSNFEHKVGQYFEVEVVTVVDVDSEDHVGNSLLQIWELTFGPKTKLFFRL